MITNLLPWIAVAVAIGAIVARDGNPILFQKPGQSKSGEFSKSSFATLLPLGELLVAFALALLALIFGWFYRTRFEGFWPASLAFTGGIAFTALSSWIGGHPNFGGASRTGPLALAAAAVGLLQFLVSLGIEPLEMGLAFGFAIGAWLFGGNARALTSALSLKVEGLGRDWPSATALFGIVILMADDLGRRTAGGPASHAGLLLAVCAVVIAIAVAFARAKGAPNMGALSGWGLALLILLLSGAAWLVATRYVFLESLWWIYAGAVVVALAVHSLNSPRAERNGLGFALSTVIWLGAATVAFGLMRGFGMAAVLLGAATLLLLLDNRTALLSLGPLAAFVAYRIFREMHLSASRALDIGQHYALIGLVAGTALIVVAWEYRRAVGADGDAHSASRMPALAKGLCAILLAAVPVLSIALLAEKGYIGMMAGLGVGALVLGLQGVRSEIPLALVSGLGNYMCMAFVWAEDLIGLTRQEKLTLLYWSAPILIVIMAILAFIVRSANESSLSNSPKPAESGAH